MTVQNLYYYYYTISLPRSHSLTCIWWIDDSRPLSYVCYFILFVSLLKACHAQPLPSFEGCGLQIQPTHMPCDCQKCCHGPLSSWQSYYCLHFSKAPLLQTHAFSDFRKPCHSRKQHPRQSEMTGDKSWFRDIRARLNRVRNGFQWAQGRWWGQSDRWMSLWKMWGESCCKDESILT